MAPPVLATTLRRMEKRLDRVPALAGGIAAPLFTETILPLVHNVLTLDQVAAVRAVGGGESSSCVCRHYAGLLGRRA
eukprot:COSAG01_NODE_14570_length_1437_cov_0.833333_2_plen_77_part_00